MEMKQWMQKGAWCAEKVNGHRGHHDMQNKRVNGQERA